MDKKDLKKTGVSTAGAVFRDLGFMDYEKALELQIRTRDRIIEGPGVPDHIYFVQHPRVYTLGKRGGRENLMVSEFFLERENIRVIQTSRGGNITFHCPGQAVLYPVVHLERARIGVKDFVAGLEAVMERTAAQLGVHTAGDPVKRGLWAGASKIGSVGLAVKKGVSIHGLALNITPDLTPFSWIHPCGFENLAMTSIEKELLAQGKTQDLSTDRIKEMMFGHFCDIFHFTPVEDQGNRIDKR